jgi:DNA repair photolyase
MRTEDNPRNRFDRYYKEWEVEPPAAAIEVSEDMTRSILAENDSPDIGFRYSVNPYRGCSHACAYCYARPSHEYLGLGAGTDFDTRIRIKPRAAELLRQALRAPRWKHELIMFSGDTDCYQPLEAHYRLTRACLEVCLEERNPVSIVTKAFLVTRDLDVLAAMAREGLVRVGLSIPFADPDLARALEPGAPRPEKRFEAMRMLADAGVPAGILVAPIIPGLNDDQIPRLLELAKENGARAASRVLLRLPGAVREVFLSRLREKLPLRAARVEARLSEARGGRLNDPRFGHRMSGQGAYWQAIDRVFQVHRRRLGLDLREAGSAELAGASAPVPAPAPRQERPRRREAQLSLFEG